MRHPYACYRCFHCLYAIPNMRDYGPQRQLWCTVCACQRPFVRVEQRITATTWPPPAREDML